MVVVAVLVVFMVVVLMTMVAEGDEDAAGDK